MLYNDQWRLLDQTNKIWFYTEPLVQNIILIKVVPGKKKEQYKAQKERKEERKKERKKYPSVFASSKKVKGTNRMQLDMNID